MTSNAALSATRTRLDQILQADSVWAKALLVIAAAYLTGLAAQIIIPLPFTAVPITAQVFVVLLIAGLYRPTLAAASQVLYLAAGAAGLPWYAGGIARFGITGGYIVGFVVAAILVSTLLKHPAFRKSALRVATTMSIGVAIIYLLGATWYAIMTQTSLQTTVSLAVTPFIIGDAIKIAFAAAIVYAARPDR